MADLINIKFFFQPSIEKLLNFGETLSLIGNSPFFNDWNVNKSLNLFWKTNHIWSTMYEINILSINENPIMEYKYLINNKYEPNDNHTINLLNLNIDKTKSGTYIFQFFLKIIWQIFFFIYFSSSIKIIIKTFYKFIIFIDWIIFST